MKHPVDNQLVMRFRRATGLPVLVAKRELEHFNPEEQLARVFKAENRPSGICRDPMEEDERIGPIIRNVMTSVAVRVRQERELRIDELRKTDPAMADFLSVGRGMCHRIWHETKLQLESEHGIDWRSPAELNPDTMFD